MGHGRVGARARPRPPRRLAPTSSAAAAAASAFVRSCASARAITATGASTWPSGNTSSSPTTRKHPSASARAETPTLRPARALRDRDRAAWSSASYTRRSSPVWCVDDPAPWPRRSRSNVPCQSRWSGVIASSTATRGRNASCANASWNDDTSATMTPADANAGRRLRRCSGRPMLPAAIVRTPDASSIAAIIVVTVVFPFVPVTATIGTRARSAARSISLRTAMPRADAASRSRDGRRAPAGSARRGRPPRPARAPGRPWAPRRARHPSPSTAAARSRVAGRCSRCVLDHDDRPGPRRAARGPRRHPVSARPITSTRRRRSVLIRGSPRGAGSRRRRCRRRARRRCRRTARTGR